MLRVPCRSALSLLRATSLYFILNSIAPSEQRPRELLIDIARYFRESDSSTSGPSSSTTCSGASTRLKSIGSTCVTAGDAHITAGNVSERARLGVCALGRRPTDPAAHPSLPVPLALSRVHSRSPAPFGEVFESSQEGESSGLACIEELYVHRYGLPCSGPWVTRLAKGHRRLARM
jgi:hypothetical protein